MASSTMAEVLALPGVPCTAEQADQSKRSPECGPDGLRPSGPPRKRLVVIVKAGQRRVTPTSSVACPKTDGGNANAKGITTNVIPAQSAAPQAEPRRQARIPRPANAFMLFAQEQRRKVAAQHPQENNKRVSTLLGQLWRDLPKDQMELYHQRANDVASEHRQRYPDYVYNPREARQRKTEERRAKQLALELKRSMSASVAERRQQARVKPPRAQQIVKRTKRAQAHPRPVGQADVATAIAETTSMQQKQPRPEHPEMTKVLVLPQGSSGELCRSNGQSSRRVVVCQLPPPRKALADPTKLQSDATTVVPITLSAPQRLQSLQHRDHQAHVMAKETCCSVASIFALQQDTSGDQYSQMHGPPMIPTGETPTSSLHAAVFSSNNTAAFPTWTHRQTTDQRATASLPGYPHLTTFVESYTPPVVEVFLGQNLELRGPYEDRRPCLRQQHGQGSLVSRHASLAHQPIATARLKSVVEVERQQLTLCSPSRVLLGQPMGEATALIARSSITGADCTSPTSRPGRPNPHEAWTGQRPRYPYLSPVPLQLPTGVVLPYPPTAYPFAAGPASSFRGAFAQGATLPAAAAARAPVCRAPGVTMSVPVFGREPSRWQASTTGPQYPGRPQPPMVDRAQQTCDSVSGAAPFKDGSAVPGSGGGCDNVPQKGPSGGSG